MSAKWKEFRLGDVTEWTSGGTPSKQNADFWNGTIPWISASSMGSNRYNESDQKITQDGLKAGSRLAKKDSILLLVRGSTLHQRIPVGIVTSDVSFNQDVKAIKAKEEFIDPWYLLFWFMGKEKDLLNMVENTGIGAGKLDTKRLQDMLIKIPPVAERNKIRLFAKALDDKLWINRQINQTLESMAQTIFKSWFVDFEPVKAKIAAIESGEETEAVTRAAMRAISGKTDDKLDHMQAGEPEHYDQLKTTSKLFPADMQNSELGEIPEGWKVGKLKNHSNQIIRGFTSKYVEKSNLINLNQKVNRGSYLDKSNYKYYPEDTKVPEEKYAKKKDILINSLGQGTLGRVHLFWEDENNIVIDQHITVIRTNYVSLYPEYLYNYLSQRGTQYRLESHVTGTTGMLMLNVSKIRDFPVLVPDENIQRTFSIVVSDFYHQIYKNIMENEILSQIRDSLLPKLLSGKLEVNAGRLEEEN